MLTVYKRFADLVLQGCVNRDSAICRCSDNDLHCRQEEMVMRKFINKIDITADNDSAVVIHWFYQLTSLPYEFQSA